MNKLTLYFRQALHMMKEERLFSGIYIAGTALASVCDNESLPKGRVYVP